MMTEVRLSDDGATLTVWIPMEFKPSPHKSPVWKLGAVLPRN